MKKPWSLLTIMMVAMLNFTFISCSDDDKEKETPKDNPLVGNWLYVSEEDMVCYLLTFTDKGTFDYQSQKVETKNSFGGTFTYNETTKKLVLTPTRTSELPIEFQVKSVDEQSLIVTDEAGKILIFSKTFDSHFPMFDWKEKTPDQMLIGMWEASDGKGRTMKLSFRSDGVLTGLMYNSRENTSRGYAMDEPYEDSFMSTYELDTNTMTLSTNTSLDNYNDWGWNWKEYSKSVSITETTLNMDGYEYTKYSDIPTDLCEEALILGAWKQTTSNGYILFTFKADGTVIRHELNGSTWEPYEELTFVFDPGELLRIGNETWHEKDSSTNTELHFTHDWWYNEHITLSKTDEKELFLGGKSILYERISMLEHKTWTYVETYEGEKYKLTLEFNRYAWYQYYENDELIVSYRADYYYDYRNNGIYFKDWRPTGEEDMFDYLEIANITENTLSIKNTDGSIITFYNR